MPNPKKLLVADTHARAKFLIHELELDPTVWVGIGVGGAVMGYRFERIVDLTTTRPMSEVEIRRWQEWFAHLRCRLYRNTK